MNTNDTQQKHSYHEFIENFSFLFKEIKEKDENLLSNEIRKEDESIYNAVVGFNTVKFLTEHADWNWDEDENKNKAYEVILPEWNKIKKAEQKLESEVKARLKEYVDDVAGVSIYGNHASITLGDDKKEFKISEFLNSDFCQKNGISGFSTLHSDGKSGMHGFVAEEGGKKVRHYVVTDGSYEMTLNWYVNGEKCTIKVNIDKEGVKLIEGNGVTKDQLKANEDVKIGGLFLHEIEFKKKEKAKENEVEHDGQGNQVLNKSFETFIGSDISKGVGVQATQDQEVESKHATTSTINSNNASAKKIPPPPPPRTSSLPSKKDIVNEQGGSIFTQSSGPDQNDRQRDERSTFTTFEHTESGNQKADRNEQIPNNQQQPSTQLPKSVDESGFSSPTTDHSQFQVDPEHLTGKLEEEKSNRQKEDEASEEHGKNSKDHNSETHKVPITNPADQAMDELKEVLKKPDRGLTKPVQQVVEKNIPKDSFSENILPEIKEEKSIYKWLKDKIEGKEDNQNLDTMEEKLSQTSSISKDLFSENVLEKIKEDKPIYKWLKDKIEGKEDNQNLDTMEEKLSQTSSISKGPFSENILEKIEKGSQYKPIRNWLKDKIEGKENNQNLDALEEKLSKKYGQGNIVEKRENDDGKPLSPVSIAGNVDVGQSKDTQLQESSRRSGQESAEEERNFQKISEALESWKEKRRNTKQSNSNPSSQIHANHNESQVNPEHPTRKLEEEKSNCQKEDESSEEHGKNSKDHNSETHEVRTELVDKNTQFANLADQVWLKDKVEGEEKLSQTGNIPVAGQENNDTNPSVDKNRELYKLLEKDAAQLKAGVIEEEKEDTLTECIGSPDRNRIASGNKNRLLWAKHVKQQQENKDKGMSI